MKPSLAKEKVVTGRYGKGTTFHARSPTNRDHSIDSSIAIRKSEATSSGDRTTFMA